MGKTHTGLFRVTWSASRAQRERILTFSVEGRAFVEEGVVGNGAVASFTRSCSIHGYVVREDFARNTGNFGRIISHFKDTFHHGESPRCFGYIRGELRHPRFVPELSAYRLTGDRLANHLISGKGGYTRDLTPRS